jgi:hypothetical protein
MLEGLDTVGWHGLSHPYGEPEKVSVVLRRAAEGDLGAVEELWNALEHQGTIYEVTAAAVPFLLELLPRQRPELRAELLGLLVHLAGGSSYLSVHLPLLRRDLGAGVEDYRDQLRAEVTTVAEVREAVRRRWPGSSPSRPATSGTTRACAWSAP